MVWSEGNMSLKNPVTPPGIDPGTVRLVAQRLSHYATPGPKCRYGDDNNSLSIVLQVTHREKNIAVEDTSSVAARFPLYALEMAQPRAESFYSLHVLFSY